MTESDGVKVFRSASGAWTASVNGRLLHSRHDPEREASRTMEAMSKREPPAVVFLGMGLGHHVRQLLEKTDRTHVLIYEPNERLLHHAQEKQIVRLSDNRLSLARNPEELDGLLSERGRQGFETFALKNRFDQSDEAAARSVLDAFASRLEINLNTLHRFGRLWVRNLCHNLPQLVHARGVTDLFQLSKAVPALVLAAGPTLDQILDQLPELAQSVLIVAVDTAVSRALSVGVEPDVAVVVDPQYWNSRHLDRVHCQNTVLVSEFSAHPHVFRSFEPPYLFCSSVFPLGRRYEQAIGTFGQLGAGGSVTTTAWDLARKMGCSPIYVAGLDLGFPDGRTHCKESFFEMLALTLGSRSRTAEEVIFNYLHSASPHMVQSNANSQILSDRRMDIYRNWFETQMNRSAAQTISITSGGSFIEGVSVSDPEHVLSLPDSRTRISQLLKTFRQKTANSSESIQRRRTVITEETNSILKNLYDLVSLSSSASNGLREARNTFLQTGAADFSALNEADQRMMDHPAGEIAGFLLQEAIDQIELGFGSSSIKEQFDASQALYEGLTESTMYHIHRLEQSSPDAIITAQSTKKD